jgi:hypothetical protein
MLFAFIDFDAISTIEIVCCHDVFDLFPPLGEFR